MQHTYNQGIYNQAAASRDWWMLALRGLLAVIFGLIALFDPGIALLAFIVVFAVYAIIDGIIAASVAVRERSVLPNWGWVLVEGLLGIIAGVLAIFFPQITALILLYIVGAWAIVTGITQIAAAISLRDYISHEWALILAGVISILFGILLFIFPGAGLLSILWLIGIYSIFFGVLFIVRAFHWRSLGSPTATQHRSAI